MEPTATLFGCTQCHNVFGHWTFHIMRINGLNQMQKHMNVRYFRQLQSKVEHFVGYCAVISLVRHCYEWYGSVCTKYDKCMYLIWIWWIRRNKNVAALQVSFWHIFQSLIILANSQFQHSTQCIQLQQS